jgi:N-acetylmuramoyl-L-alanine amidase
MHWSKTLFGQTALGAIAILAPGSVGSLSGQAQAPPVPAARFVVVLDAAHGGDDTGGRLASGQLEKAATLALSVRLRSLLGARGIPVITTRESDANLDPDRRAGIANHAKAAACIGLHVTESGSGIHLFTSSLAPARPAHFVAWKTAQSEWVPSSLALAGSLNSALQRGGFNVLINRTALIAIDSMTCPAVAVEIAPERGPDGKVTSEPDDPAYQARIANTLATAVLEWRTDASRTAEAHQP